VNFLPGLTVNHSPSDLHLTVQFFYTSFPQTWIQAGIVTSPGIVTPWVNLAWLYSYLIVCLKNKKKKHRRLSDAHSQVQSIYSFEPISVFSMFSLLLSQSIVLFCFLLVLVTSHRCHFCSSSPPPSPLTISCMVLYVVHSFQILSHFTLSSRNPNSTSLSCFPLFLLSESFWKSGL
jgi:hypothetical protein